MQSMQSMQSIAFLFSGQGAQYAGMFQDVAAAYPCANHIFQQANQILGEPLSDLIFHGTQEQLDLTTTTQPALLTAELAALRVLDSRGVRPSFCAGFSLGEWAALVCAGVLSAADALPLVRMRAQFMQTAVPVGAGGMAVILGKSADEVVALCDRVGGITPSNYNCPGQITVAGHMQAIERLLNIATKDRIVAKKLPVSVPSHCSLMQPAAVALQEYLEKIEFCNARYPIVMNCSATMEQDAQQIKQNMIRQLTEPVRFEESIVQMLHAGATAFVEIGPGKTLCSFVKKIAKKNGIKVCTFCTDRTELLDEVCTALGGDVC